VPTARWDLKEVVDRLIQQALHQVLSPLFDPDFSVSSYGFRPEHSAHQALCQAREHVAEGRRWVVELDLEKFFDRVHHDVLMSRVARKVGDKRVLCLIRRYLKAGIMEGGLISQSIMGMPQGGPLSPLLSNILLDELDKELERRGHRFCRYADLRNWTGGYDADSAHMNQAFPKRFFDRLGLVSLLDSALKFQCNS
jgi:RNA-directed DNA polymerase